MVSCVATQQPPRGVVASMPQGANGLAVSYERASTVPVGVTGRKTVSWTTCSSGRSFATTTCGVPAQAASYAYIWNSIYSNRNISVTLQWPPGGSLISLAPGSARSIGDGYYAPCTGSTYVSVNGSAWSKKTNCQWHYAPAGTGTVPHKYVVKSLK